MIDNPRWFKLNHHAEMMRFFNSEARFRVAAAGRRSGKTESEKRRLVIKALEYTRTTDGLFVFAAPTRDQAKRIFWKDAKKLVPDFAIRKISESDLVITLHSGTEIVVAGLDKPQRIEGVPIDYIVIDEYAETKPETWATNIRPALSTLNRPGEAAFIGVPRGRNHYYELFKHARSPASGSEWEAFHWKSSDLLPQEEIESAKASLDELTYRQEYEASFVSFEGRAYHAFDQDVHVRNLYLRQDQPLIATFDFNVDPGTAGILQHQYKADYPEFEGWDELNPEFTAVLKDIYIENNANTPMVARAVCNAIKDMGYKGRVYLYGDATGHWRGSAKIRGTDWDLVEETFKEEGVDYVLRVKKRIPPERARINSVNARFKAANGAISYLIHAECAKSIEDYEGVALKKDGSGEIDKKASSELTHLSDGHSYYIQQEHPAGSKKVTKVVRF